MSHDPIPPSAPPLAAHYGELYYRHYSHSADTPYRRDDPVWASFFGEMARLIGVGLRPRSVLDVGCAMGMLVEGLRDQGVDAWGLDVSAYAISQARADIRAFCRVGSAADEFERDYDLITCIEVLEHLPAAEADRAVANFARHSGLVLLSSTPDDYQEPTHINVQPTDYWVGLFARHGLHRDLDFDAYFISPHAMLFRRQPGVPIETLRAYERQAWQAQVELRSLRASYQRAVEAQRRLAADLEHHQFERRLLSGEAAHWEWRTGLAQAEASPAAPTAPSRPGGAVGRLGPAVRRTVAALRRAGASGAAPPVAIGVPPAPPPHAAAAGARRVLFVSDGADGSRRYRCEHQAEALDGHGWRADVVTYTDRFGFLAPYLDGYDVFVLQRLPLRPSLEVFIADAHRQAKPVVFDVDDLIFEPEQAAFLAPVAAMSDDDRWATKHGLWRTRQAMRLCDAVCVPTEPLGEAARTVRERVWVSPNAVSQAMQQAADEALAARATRPPSELLTLAYLSGTPTHDRDVGSIAPALRWALETYPQVRLLLVGPLARPPELGEFGERVQHLDLQPWSDLPGLLAGVSINLAPLEVANPFTEAKSCLKYLEAGLLGVPTIASPRHDFARVIRHGDNGLLADAPAGWQDALRELIEGPVVRARLGQRAREDVLARHTTAARGPLLDQMLSELIHARAEQPV